MHREVYLDNSATTRPFDEVIELMSEVNRNTYGNPSSMHTKGIQAERLVKKARDIVAASMNIESKEIYFTSGGTESNNLAILGYLEANPRQGMHIITSKIEHPSVQEVYKNLSGKGYKVDFVDVDKNGIVNLEQVRSLISSETAIISLIYVNNEIGSVQPVDELVKIKNSIKRDAVIHLDAVQAYGKLKISPKKLGIDLMSVSSHKIHGPKGVGALYVNKGIKIKPVFWGGGQEDSIRSGTENVPGISGFGLAAEIIHGNLEGNNTKVTRVGELFIKRLKEDLEDVKINSPEQALPNIINVSFRDVKAEVLLHHLEEKNIFVSTGSACSSRKNVHSHVLKAIGLEACDIEGAIRFSISMQNGEDDIEYTISNLKNILPKIKIRRGGIR